MGFGGRMPADIIDRPWEKFGDEKYPYCKIKEESRRHADERPEARESGEAFGAGSGRGRWATARHKEDFHGGRGEGSVDEV
jgi:hypothetical protein